MRPDPYAWSADTDVLVIVPGLLVVYAAAARVFPTPLWRAACFAAGLALVLAAHVTPLAAISNHYLLSAHLLQNVTLAEWAPALCVLGLSPALASWLTSMRGARLATHPAFALPLWLATYFAWHLPWVYDAALRHPTTLLHLEHACYFASGCLLWWPVLHRRPHAISSGAKAAYLFLAFVLVSPVSLLLALLPTPVYDFYEHAPRLWDLSAATDQQIAGVTMAVEEAVVFFAACSLFLLRFLREEETRGLLSSGSG